MILSDNTIKEKLLIKDIIITPLNLEDIQPASVDLHLSAWIRIYDNYNIECIDVKKDLENLTTKVLITEEMPFILHPGEFILASTIEWIELANHIVARLEGKSSLGRLGLVIHSTVRVC